MTMQTTLRARLGAYEAVLVQRRYAAEYDTGIWHGGAETPPRWVVKSLEVRYKQQRLPLGRGVYGDLAEVNTMRFTRNARGEVVLQLEGGDAADSYRALLVFRNGVLIRRRVEWSAFPNKFYEETRYVNIPVED